MNRLPPLEKAGDVINAGSDNYLEEIFKSYQSDADFHAMQHTFITNFCRANVPPKTAQALARHRDIRLTMNTYSHVGQQEQAVAIDALPGPQSATAMRS